jgi:hypothetical protein
MEKEKMKIIRMWEKKLKIPSYKYRYFKIYKSGKGLVIAKNETGKIRFAGKNASEVIQKCIDSFPHEITLFGKEGEMYEIKSPITLKSGTKIVGKIKKKEGRL